MAYSFSDSADQKILRDAVREFATQEIAPVAAKLDEQEEFSLDTAKKMAEMGFFGIFIGEQYGGQGMDYISYAIIVEELARVDSSHAATIAAHNSLGCGPLYYFGTEEQKKTYLPPITSDGGLWAFGLTEPDAGSDAQASKTRATLRGGKWSISGSKLWITNSASELTRGYTMQAVTGTDERGRNELSCFLVPAGSKGITAKVMHEKMMWRASNTGELYFDDVLVDESAFLGKQGQGFKIMMQTLDGGRLSIAAMGVGLAQGALDLALKYAKERKTFGKEIIKHQAVGFKLADMAIQVETARGLLYKACWLKDEGKPFAKEAAMAKLYASEAAEFCAREGQQIFGGYGLMKEYPIERHYRDAALLRIGEGTSEIQRLVISRYL
jgi:alkylation response protein AidB-like acyl-CoA dehydrogenase